MLTLLSLSFNSFNFVPFTLCYSPDIPVGSMASSAQGGSGDGNKAIITILHFNDVYNIEPRETEPVGGAARFVTAIKQMSHLNPLVLFSGDAFNPSVSE